MAQQAVNDHVQPCTCDDLALAVKTVEHKGRREERLAAIGHAADAIGLDTGRQLGKRAVGKADVGEQRVTREREHVFGKRHGVVKNACHRCR